MEKKLNLGAIASGAGKSAAEFLGKAKDKAIKVMDQNEDGKFDMKDVSQFASTVGNVAKNAAVSVKNTAEEKAKEYELKTLMPIFPDTLNDADFLLTKLIRVCDRDKKRSESEVCQGAIGYFSDYKDFRIVNIYRDSLDYFGITFVTEGDYELYYVDPRDRDSYIALDEYFGHIKVSIVNELQKLAQDLGAKHFRVTYKEEKAAVTNQKAKASVKAGVVNGEGELSHSQTELSTVSIAAEMDCPGHEPIKPTLHYLQKDSCVQNLINMRMDERSPLTHQKFSIRLSNSSGIKESDAIKIDAVIKGLKCTGNASMVSEAKTELRRILDYEIDF